MSRTIVFIFLGCLGLPQAHAAASATGPHVQVTLLTEQRHLTAGQDVMAGLHFVLEKHWHIYWINPGDSGQATRVQWTLPEDVAADPIQWPVPRRLPVGPLVNYGYEDEVLLPMLLHTRATAAGGEYSLRAEVKWLVCAETCIPGSASLDTALTVDANGRAAPRARADSAQPAATEAPNPADIAALFEATRAGLPKPAPGLAQAGIDATSIKLILTQVGNVTGATFFPHQPQQIDNAASQRFMRIPGGFELTLPRAEELTQEPPRLAGLVVVEADSPFAWQVDVPLQPMATTPLWWVLLAAFSGGLILNLMPCVFPVLSLKVMTFVRMSGHERGKMRLHAWLYAAGVLVAFWLLTAALLGLRLAGAQIGWGFQLQSSRFVALLASLLFLFGLNLLGIFEIGGSIMGMGQSLAGRDGKVGAFFTGVLATVVATPCTAPFMGSAVGFALSQPPFICELVFTALGVGLALPYVLLCYIPAAARLLPRPGAWMETLKQVTAFPLFATVIWLVWVFSLQTGTTAVAWLLADFLLLSMGAWIVGRWATARQAQVGGLVLWLAALALGTWEANAVPAHASAPSTHDGLTWEAYSPERVAQLRALGQPVLIDFTAAWCVSCKVNELVVLGSAPVQDKLRALHVVLMRADWTSQDPVITQTLASFGRSGVPLYVLYGKTKNAPAVQLPEVITASVVLAELNKL